MERTKKYNKDFFDYLQSWGLDVSEYIIVTMITCAFTLVMVHTHRYTLYVCQ
jgi:hypothetical protein